MAVEAFAPAKINLTLHVTGQRADGYHLLDSLVVFADVGDRIIVRAAQDLTLAIDGPMAVGLPLGDDNLVLRAARFFGAGGAAITLTKRLPVSSGIGGGSADAAATLRALSQLWQRPLPAAAATAVLGADVPVCLAARPCRMSGIGSVLAEGLALPPIWVVLVNPGVAVSTPDVFRALQHRAEPPMPAVLPDFSSAVQLAGFLRAMRNDLEQPARQLEPSIGAALSALAADGACLLARMSGSGATCFGLYAEPEAAKSAARNIARLYPGWWVIDTAILG